MIALIPARSGSKRVPGKNTRNLAGHPLLAYTIAAAQQSGIFEWIVVSTDSYETGHYAYELGAQVRCVDAPCHTDTCCDITWIRDALEWVKPWRPESFAILRPTSPFRTAATILRAYKEFQQMADCGDSIRAVEKCPVNVYKCWTWAGAGMPIKPLLEGVVLSGDGPAQLQVPLHSAPSQLAPVVWIQNSSLEMAHTANVELHGTIHGKKVGPFFTQGYEGFSIDTERDWAEACEIAKAYPEALPPVSLARV